MNKNQDSLRQQIIEAINDYLRQYRRTGIGEVDGTDIFDNAVMPVLKAAMDAGELLLHRATTPQAPVPERIITWLEGCLEVSGRMHTYDDITAIEATSVLYQLEDGAHRALADVKQLQPTQTTKKSLMGRLLTGKPLPMKG